MIPDRTCDQRPATSDPPPISEALLVRLWAGQRFPESALATRDGRPLRVLHPGRRGRGAGPDFRGALIAPERGRPLRGDVELHVRASDFRAHGHHRDARYNRVVLHVVVEDDAGEDTALVGGGRAPVVALGPWLRRRAAEIERWLSAPRLWREPCAHAVARLGTEGVVAALERLGDGRFDERAATLGRAIEERGAAEALYRALLEALSYGGAALAPIADVLPWAELEGRLAQAPDEERRPLAEALLLGAAGLLPPDARHPHERRLFAAWRASGRSSAAARPGARVARPANHPARRLAGLARLVVRHDLTAPPALAGPTRRLIAAWSAPADGYWERNVAPGLPAGRPQGALIGRGRAIELLVNAVLPWAVALATRLGDRALAGEARARFAALPRPGGYGALAFLERNLGAGGPALPLNARRQQGLLALYKTECTQGGCGRCALS